MRFTTFFVLDGYFLCFLVRLGYGFDHSNYYFIWEMIELYKNKCNSCGKELVGINDDIRPYNVYSGSASFQENVCLCSSCVNKKLRDFGFVLCDFCGESVACIGKAEHFLNAWRHSPSGEGFELQSVCKWAVENGIVQKCPCCYKQPLCSKEVWVELGNQCPECYRDYDVFYEDILAEEAEYIDGYRIDDLIEHFGTKKIGGKKFASLEDMFR